MHHAHRHSSLRCKTPNSSVTCHTNACSVETCLYRRGNLRSKCHKNRIFDKIWFLTWFGLVLRSDSESAWKIMQIRSLKSWFGQNLKKSIVYKFAFWLFFDFWAVFQGLGVSKSNAASKNTPGALSLDFFARWEARTAPGNPPWEPPWGRKLLRL